MKRQIFGVIAALLATAPAHAQLDQKTRLQVFNLVWSRVNERHFDPTFGGVNWKAVKTKYAPKVAITKDDSAFYALLTQMLGELKQSHFGIIPPDAYVAKDAEAEHATGAGKTGITVSLLGTEVVVTQVEAGSGAASAGIKPGFVLLKADSKDLSSVITKLQERKERTPMLQAEARMAVQAFLSGDTATPAVLEVLDTEGKPQTVSVRRTAEEGKKAVFGNLPPLPVVFESKKLDGNIGYLRFNIFLMPNLDAYRKAVAELSETEALIIDLRGNPGGIGAMAQAISGTLTESEGTLGTMKTRVTQINFTYTPQPPRYTKPVVILVDELSASTSEILAAGLQENHRATVIGRQTPGMVLPSMIEKLPGGVRLQYATGDYKTPKGVLVEGHGVVPDIPVALTRELLLTDPDPILTAAITFLQKKN